MSAAITEGLKKTYSENIMLQVQQMSNILEPTVYIKPNCSGEADFQGQLAASEAKEKTARNQNVDNEDPQLDQRKIVPRYFYKAPLVDRLDKVMLVKDPTNELVVNNAAALARAKDTVIAGAFFATAYTGAAGTTSVAFPTTTNQIAAASAGLTLTKLRSAIQILNKNEVEKADRFCVHSAAQLTDLLGDTTLTSNDYNTVKALVKGEVDTFLGLKFVSSERITKSSTTRKCAVYQKKGMCLGVWLDMLTSIDILPGKHFSAQVYAGQSYGATRLEEKLVVEVDCYEA